MKEPIQRLRGFIAVSARTCFLAGPAGSIAFRAGRLPTKEHFRRLQRQQRSSQLDACQTSQDGAASGLGGMEVTEVGQEAQGCMLAMLQAGKAVSAGLHPLQAQQRVGVLGALCGRGITSKRLRQPPHATPVCAPTCCRPLAGCCSTSHMQWAQADKHRLIGCNMFMVLCEGQVAFEC